ncbi:hypothetical protein [Blastococcus tunisiensis]|uniref:Uncharacterized protein n=1 Tax=Blastococcus tunisiensis TaxID=1798228 RepID=A0A1I2J9G5_9ACTN|nr:hypothetical protein [Blastococcus sp. DSM 46838]SFF50640.1 hypothetical protein SAMN05216574_11576 [Blastococcus sp. DSM 46838]
MSDQQSSEGASRTFVRGLRSTVGRESTTFGFSILATVTFGMLQVTQGSPDLPRVFLYAVGAVLSFTLLEGVLSRGFRRPMPQHPTQTMALGTSLNVISVLVGLGAALLVSEWFSHVAVWCLAPFVAGVGYLLAESVEDALAERILVAAGDDSAKEVSP